MEFKPLWHYRVIDFGESLGILKGLTQHMRVRSGINGTGLRVKLDNRFNKGKMSISSMAISSLDGEGNTINTAKLTVNGSDRIVLEPDESIFTDYVKLSVSIGQYVEVDLCFEIAEGVAGICQTWSPRVWNSWFTKDEDPEVKLDCTDLFPLLAEDVHKPWAALGISQIDLMADESVLTLSMFGDSITHMSFYSDALFERLLREFPGKAVIANCGIGGNRLCSDHIFIPGSHGNGRCFGPAGKERFEGDVYTDMKPNIVLVLLGTNDCNLGLEYGCEGEFPAVERYSSDYSNIIRIAHQHGSVIYAGTIMPFNTPDWAEFHDRAEARRLELNAWIRSQRDSDGVIDFDAVAEDPVRKGVLREDFDMGDRLHPGVNGGRLMASVVPLDQIISSK